VKTETVYVATLIWGCRLHGRHEVEIASWNDDMAWVVADILHKLPPPPATRPTVQKERYTVDGDGQSLHRIARDN
jgi:hypothetical protein